ncbi:MAG: EVE domain-containing protein [Elusimicrobia bacterium]|nr:EVE domain-containing protein [Elusimicrobiota bacterium]
MKYWLMKSEPSVFSIEDLRKKKVAGWDGVRNYQARNFMKEMALGDQAFFYHSSCETVGVAGIMEVAKTAYPDPTQFDKKDGHFDPKAKPGAPIWFHVDVKFVKTLPRIIELGELRAMPELKGMALFRLGRISITPVTESEWAVIAARR